VRESKRGAEEASKAKAEANKKKSFLSTRKFSSSVFWFSPSNSFCLLLVYEHRRKTSEGRREGGS
jgi:hypothetical protein